MSNSKLSDEQINEILTLYIVEINNTYELNNAVNDIDQIRKLMNEDPVITHYPSPARYWSKSEDDVIECNFSELFYTDMYDLLHYSLCTQKSKNSKDTSPTPSLNDKFDEMQTGYIVELYDKYQITGAIPTLAKHRELLEKDPMIYYYLFSGTTIWSYTPLFPETKLEDLEDTLICRFCELSPELRYNMLCNEETKEVEYQSSLMAWT